jgi:hypothetical protein
MRNIFYYQYFKFGTYAIGFRAKKARDTQLPILEQQAAHAFTDGPNDRYSQKRP